MKLVVPRGEEPPDDAVVVIRGGANSLTGETVTRSAERNMVAFGFLGLSVFLAEADDVAQVCGAIDELRRYRQIRRSVVARLTTAGFALLAAGDAPHFESCCPISRQRRSTAWSDASTTPNPTPGDELDPLSPSDRPATMKL